MAGKKDFLILQGTTFKYTLTIEQIEEDRSRVVTDLTGCEVAMQIRPNALSNQIYLDLKEDGYISITDAAQGQIELEIPPEVTRTLDFSSAVYDMELTFPDGYIMRVIEGRISLSPEVTR